MSSRIEALSFMLVVFFFFQRCYVSAFTNGLEASALRALKNEWTRSPKSWEGSDPCGTNWVGITCTNNRVVSISLVNHNLEGTLSEYISALSELEILDLSFNTGLTGPLPPNIGNLKKLKNLILVGCGFSGQIPESVGSLEQLIKLALNSNKFNGTIPASVGRLSKLDWFDIDDNRIEGELPISNGTSSPGLDMLLQTQHFHFGKNKLSGDIPEKLFSSNMKLIHVLFNDNQFTGKIPKSLGLVTTMLVIRLDTNRLSGDIPPSLNNLTRLDQLHLANNKFTGSLPNLASLTVLDEIDVSNNTLEFSLVPSWISSLRNLSTLKMEGIQLIGSIPISLFSLIRLQYVNLKRNRINGTLEFGTNYSKQLKFVDLRYNNITGYKQAANERIQVILANNPVCGEVGNMPSFCSAIQHQSSFSIIPIYNVDSVA
ncbi:leucine-rich repeat family protein, partial [Arabidopsis lyrata subsp. lyrata]